jgi:hypothetical protein
MAIKFRGEKYAELDFNKITPGEVGALEKQVGMVFPKIRRAAEVCVCDHGRNDHLHKDDATGEPTDDTSCVKCESCDEHLPSLPSDVSTALVWLAIKRHLPTVTYREVADTSYDDLADDEPAQEPANPTA